jgi:predicted RecA/RadA family phage recombinase
MKNFLQEGKVLTLVESLLVHPVRSSGFVNAGDPVVVGSLVGVAYDTALASTDQIDIATEDVYDLSVLAKDANAADDAVVFGDQVYINPTTAVLSKDNSGNSYGIALGTVAAGNTSTIPVMIVQAAAASSGGGYGN